MKETALKLYLLNTLLVTLHAIDAGYWKEWTLFPMPGGIEGFLAFHVFFLGLVFYGLVEVARGTGRAKLFSLGLSGVGLFTLAIHLWAFSRGYPHFATPVSVGILAGSGMTSLFQAAVALKG